MQDHNLPSGVVIPRVLFITQSSARFGDEYDRDFHESEIKGLLAFSVSVGSYQTVTHMGSNLLKVNDSFNS